MKKKKITSRRKVKEACVGYLFLLPAAACLLIWTIYPIIKSFWYSLTDFDMLSKPVYNNFANYKDLFNDKEWRDALGRTFRYVLMFVPSLYIVSLIAAELIKHLTRGKNGIGQSDSDRHWFTAGQFPG